MKLMLNPSLRLWPLSTFLGCLDLKTGVTIGLFFALLNKVAGVYGLIAALTGSGGSLPQISLYLYSTLGLVALSWGLKAVTEEDAKRSLYFAHLFFADHVLSTAWTTFFAVQWWVYNPHDGRRVAHGKAQEEMMAKIPSTISDEERARQALTIWNHEKGFAATVIILGWLCKIYFALIVYSYAFHLRRGSYRSLPHSRSAPSATTVQAYAALAGEDELLGDEDEPLQDFYRLPAVQHGAGSAAAARKAIGTSGNGWQFGAARSPVDSRAIAARLEQGLGHEDVLFDDGDEPEPQEPPRRRAPGDVV